MYVGTADCSGLLRYVWGLRFRFGAGSTGATASQSHQVVCITLQRQICPSARRYTVIQVRKHLSRNSPCVLHCSWLIAELPLHASGVNFMFDHLL